MVENLVGETIQKDTTNKIKRSKTRACASVVRSVYFPLREKKGGDAVPGECPHDLDGLRCLNLLYGQERQGDRS